MSEHSCGPLEFPRYAVHSTVHSTVHSVAPVLQELRLVHLQEDVDVVAHRAHVVRRVDVRASRRAHHRLESPPQLDETLAAFEGDVTGMIGRLPVTLRSRWLIPNSILNA